MRVTTKICIAALATSVAFPVLAQRLPVGGSSTNKTAPENAKEDAESQTTTSTAATSTTGRKLDISKAAQKALVELQTAVNADDTATIPAKLSAAQAVAKNADELFFVASNQTKAALKANDLAAIRAGVDALQASGGAQAPDLVARYTDLGRRYKEAKQIDEAVVVLNKAMALNPNNVSTLVNLASIRDGQGQKAEAVALMQKVSLRARRPDRRSRRAISNSPPALRMTSACRSPTISPGSGSRPIHHRPAGAIRCAFIVISTSPRKTS